MPPLSSSRAGHLNGSGDQSFAAALQAARLPARPEPAVGWRIAGPAPVFPDIVAGFAVLYEVGGVQRTLLRRTNFPVTFMYPGG